MDWWRLALEGEDGRIAPGAHRRALLQRSRLISSGSSLVAGLSPGHWQNRGPQNVGGRTRSLVVDPRNEQRMWAGSVSGGLWHTENAGKTWTPVDDFLGTLAVHTLVMDPNDPDRLWVGTGEGVRGRGILRSLDGGETWQEMPATTAWPQVRRLAVHPGNGNILLAGIGQGPDPAGIYRTTDGWQSHRLVQPAYLATSVAFHPLDPSLAIGAIVDFDFQQQDWYWAIVRSEDGGKTWSESVQPGRFFGFFRRIEVSWAPSDPQIAYAQVPRGPGQEGPQSRVYRSTDGGRRFVARAGLDTAVGDWMNTVWVSPTDPNDVIAGAVNIFRSTNAAATFEGPINGGLTFTSEPGDDEVSMSSSTRVSSQALLDPFGHVDHHRVVPLPSWNGTSRRAGLVVNDGGVYRTDDLLTASNDGGWTSLNRTYQTSQFYTIAGTPDALYGGTQDNGTLRLSTGSQDAFQVLTGDGGVVAIDPRNPNRLYGEFIFLAFFRSFDGGDTIEFETFENLPDAGDPGTANFIAPYALDPHDPDRLYAGGLSVWRTEDAWSVAKPTWTRIRSPGSGEFPHDRLISSVAPDPDRPGELWVAQNDGQVFRTTGARGANPSWQTLDDNAGRDPLPDRFPTRIVHSPHDGSVYVTFGGFELDNLWRTRDHGNTWERLGAGSGAPLPAAPVRAFAEHPVFPGWLYAGTEVGVFSSTDGGSTWSTSNEGPAAVSITDLTFIEGTTTLAVATHGRGLWSIETPGGDCVGRDRALCLSASAYDVRVAFRDSSGRRGAGEAVRLTGDTGYYWFYDESNVELVVKVLNACSFSGHVWVFAGGLTDVEVDLEVTEVATGRTRRYSNPLGKAFQPIQDTAAFSCGAAADSGPLDVRWGRRTATSSAAPVTEEDLRAQREDLGSGCASGSSTLCLADDRFAVEASYRAPAGDGGLGTGVPLTSDTGFFWFFDASNVEMVLKVLDACSFSDHFWVFAGGLTDVEVELTVTDLESGAQQVYRNPPGTAFQPIQDTSAFATCP